MKILLDENIDVRLKNSFPPEHDVFTIRDMMWNGIKNGKLLQLLAANDFDCWVVVDKNLPYQQNLKELPCLIIVLDVFRNTLIHLKPLVPEILNILGSNTTDKVVVIKEAIR